MKFNGFQNLYQDFKGKDQKLFESFDRISSYISSIIAEFNRREDIGSTIKTYKQTNLPRGLGGSDQGLLVRVDAPYNHLLIWTGNAWTFADNGSNYISLFRAAPTGTGWQLCDGSNISFLNSDGTISAPFNVDNLVATPAFMKAAAAYTGAINAATVPTIAGNTASGAASLGANTSSILVNVTTPPQLVAANGHTHIDAGHVHGVGTLANTLPADPIANINLLPYFRR